MVDRIRVAEEEMVAITRSGCVASYSFGPNGAFLMVTPENTEALTVLARLRGVSTDPHVLATQESGDA